MVTRYTILESRCLAVISYPVIDFSRGTYKAMVIALGRQVTLTNLHNDSFESTRKSGLPNPLSQKNIILGHMLLCLVSSRNAGVRGANHFLSRSADIGATVQVWG